MSKRYQVFVSSTFTDLESERDKIIKNLMSIDCIPVGMEQFPATDEEQFEFIKKVIDDSDYYLVIVGARYGSLSPDGLSYTEKEYDYAVSKQIKVIALIHKTPTSLPVSKSETDPETVKKLSNFKNKLSNGRLVKYWENTSELIAEAIIGLTQTMKSYPAIGWVRHASNINTNEILNIQLENQKFKNEIDSLKIQLQDSLKEKPSPELADLSDIYEIEYMVFKQYGSQQGEEQTYRVSWSDIFYILGPHLEKNSNRHVAIDLIEGAIFAIIDPNRSMYRSLKLTDECIYTLQIQYSSLKLIESKSISGTLHWFLTKLGKSTLSNMYSVKKPAHQTTPQP